MKNFVLKLTQWFSDKGFGFGSHQGQKLFVHVSTIFPAPRLGTDFSGQEIFVLATERGERGLKVTKALTAEAYQKKKSALDIISKSAAVLRYFSVNGAAYDPTLNGEPLPKTDAVQRVVAGIQAAGLPTFHMVGRDSVNVNSGEVMIDLSARSPYYPETDYLAYLREAMAKTGK